MTPGAGLGNAARPAKSQRPALAFHGHVEMMQPDGYSEGHGTVYDPHISGGLKHNARYVTLQGGSKGATSCGIIGGRLD